VIDYTNFYKVRYFLNSMLESSFYVEIEGKKYSFVDRSYWIRKLDFDLDFVNEIREKLEDSGFSHKKDVTGYRGDDKNTYFSIANSGHFIEASFSFDTSTGGKVQDDHAYLTLKGLEKDVEDIDKKIGLQKYTGKIIRGYM